MAWPAPVLRWLLPWSPLLLREALTAHSPSLSPRRGTHGVLTSRWNPKPFFGSWGQDVCFKPERWSYSRHNFVTCYFPPNVMQKSLIHFWLCQVPGVAWAFPWWPLGSPLEHCAGLTVEPLPLRSLGSRHAGSVAAGPMLQYTHRFSRRGVLGMLALRHVGSSWSRGWTRVSCVGGWML